MPRSVRTFGPKILIGLMLIGFVACRQKAEAPPGGPPVKHRDGGTEPADLSVTPDSSTVLSCTPKFIGEAVRPLVALHDPSGKLYDEDDDDDDDDDDDKYLMPDPGCRSGWRWTGREHESELMHPGADCIDCHRRSDDAPSFALAGTIYGAANEPTDCLGAESAIIRITDATGQRIELTSNRAGNFFRTTKKGRIALPYTAEVVYQGQTRQMLAPQCETSCNSCHTATGLNGAPGRILLP